VSKFVSWSESISRFKSWYWSGSGYWARSISGPWFRSIQNGNSGSK
jgi:hypothetical protein